MATNDSAGWDARAAALDILRSERVAVIATSAHDVPWASTVFFVDDGFNIYVNTPNRTRMLKNLISNPNVSFAIDERRPTFFLQAGGIATRVFDPNELERVKARFAVKVPEAHVGGDNYTLLRIDTQILFISDFRHGYRPRAELIVGDASHESPRPD